MLPEDKFFQTNDKEKTWRRYCGFLDLTVEEFMRIQEQLLLEQIKLVADSPLAKKIMNNCKPESIEEFRQVVPLTTYEDYAPYLDPSQEDLLAVKPCYWVHTSWIRGSFKRAPWTSRFDEVGCRSMIAALILASATRRGEVNLKPGARVLMNLPTRPFGSAWIAHSMNERFSFQAIPPLEEELTFNKKIEKGFHKALATDVDFIISMSSILFVIGRKFTQVLKDMKFSFSQLFKLHPLVSLRLLRALLHHKLRGKRDLLPKDLWSVKGIVGWGADSSVYADELPNQWAEQLYQFYVSTEAGFLATQGWNKKGMTFLPDSVFLEFIPEELLESKVPLTVLLDELEVGKRYEPVITSFYGMPYLRYRQGDLIKIISQNDNETGSNLPQIVCQGRADGIIDLFSIARLDEKAISQAIDNLGLRYRDWTARKEYDHGLPFLHLCIELEQETGDGKLEQRLHKQLKVVDRHYAEAVFTMGNNPLKVDLLSKGTFQCYYGRRGASQAYPRLPRMNASDSTIQELLQLSRDGRQ